MIKRAFKLGKIRGSIIFIPRKSRELELPIKLDRPLKIKHPKMISLFLPRKLQYSRAALSNFEFVCLIRG